MVLANVVLCLFFTFAAVTRSNGQEYAQKAVLYAEKGCTGLSMTLPTNGEVPDLGHFNDRAHSVSLTGAWLFYDLNEFNMNVNGLSESLFAPNNTCFDLTNVAGKVSSVRCAGNPTDYRHDTITFYRRTTFQSTYEYIDEDNASLSSSRQISSFVITGSSPWTVYQRTAYGGTRLCLHPKPNNEASFFPDNANAGVPPPSYEFIKSIKKGCHTK